MDDRTRTGDPLTSVIIPVHNGASCIGAQLDALSHQVDAPPFEVIVCDNNSTDATAEAALQYTDRLDLRIVDADGPGSASHARNCGSVAASGDVLLFTDADDLVDRHWVRTLDQAVRSSPGLLVAGALHHEEVNDPDVLHAYDIPPDPGPYEGTLTVPAVGVYGGYLPSVAGGNFGLSRRDYLDVMGMDPAFPGGSEETDFTWRAAEQGMRIVSAPGAVVHYRLKDRPRPLFRQQRIQNQARVMLWMLYRHRGMTGPSVRYSLTEVARSSVRLLRRRSRAETLHAARSLGGNVGALQGIVLYRVLRRIPSRQLKPLVAADGERR